MLHDELAVRVPRELLDACFNTLMIEPGDVVFTTSTLETHESCSIPSNIPTPNKESMMSLEFMSRVVGDMVYCGKVLQDDQICQ